MSFNFSVDDKGIIRFTDAGAELLSVTEKLDEQTDTVEVLLCGDLLSAIAPHVEAELLAYVSLGKNIRVDLQGLESISNAGMQSFTRIQRAMDGHNGSLVLTKTPAKILKEFGQIHLDQLLSIE